jgi:hypothetical protein
MYTNDEELLTSQYPDTASEKQPSIQTSSFNNSCKIMQRLLLHLSILVS